MTNERPSQVMYVVDFGSEVGFQPDWRSAAAYTYLNDLNPFAERCEGDRHHFRFIVSPQDAERLSDLNAFTHIHVIVRGKSHDGHDLVIARDYISQGLRARAAQA